MIMGTASSGQERGIYTQDKVKGYIETDKCNENGCLSHNIAHGSLSRSAELEQFGGPDNNSRYHTSRRAKFYDNANIIGGILPITRHYHYYFELRGDGVRPSQVSKPPWGLKAATNDIRLL